MKLELRRNKTDSITLLNTGSMYKPSPIEFQHAMLLIASSRDFAQTIERNTIGLLYLEIDGVEVPSTIDNPVELCEWYLMDVQQ